MTEGITDTNIPSIQLMVGMGIPLWRIPCIRATFSKDPNVSVFWHCQRIELHHHPARPADTQL